MLTFWSAIRVDAPEALLISSGSRIVLLRDLLVKPGDDPTDWLEVPESDTELTMIPTGLVECTVAPEYLPGPPGGISHVKDWPAFTRAVGSASASPWFITREMSASVAPRFWICTPVSRSGIRAAGTQPWTPPICALAGVAASVSPARGQEGEQDREQAPLGGGMAGGHGQAPGSVHRSRCST